MEHAAGIESTRSREDGERKAGHWLICATYGHGRREAAEDVAEAAGLAPRRHLGADEDDVHAGGGADDDRRGPAASGTAAPAARSGRRASAGPHAERRVRRRGPGTPQALHAAAEHGGGAGEDAQAGVRGDEVRRGQSRHADRCLRCTGR